MKSILKKIIVSILIFESKIILKKYKPRVIAVTGSVGKTSTKDAIYTALSKSIFIRKSEKSFNSEIGLPLTIIGCKNGWYDISAWLKNILEGLELIMFREDYPKCLVLEIGADHPGDIESVSRWLSSDIVVINKVSDIPVHVEFFPNAQAVLKEKMALAKSLKKDGVLIIYSDDKKIVNESKNFKQKILSYGIESEADIKGLNIVNDINNGISFDIRNKDKIFNFNIKGVLGSQQVYPILASIAVAEASNIPIDIAIESLKNHIYPRGRMNIIDGINNSKIIDDSYNSSPDAVNEALKTLASLQGVSRKIAILGDMMELGKFSSDEHKKILEYSAKVCDIVITVGPRTKNVIDKAISFDNAFDAGEYIKSIIKDNDIVLIKGSQSMRMERVCMAIIKDTYKMRDLLVRQEDEWLAKK